MKPIIKLLIFDLDDTLAPAQVNYDQAMLEIGISPTDPQFLQARKLVKERLPHRAPVARSRFHYLKTYLELRGEYKPQLHLQMAEKYESFVVAKMKEAWDRLGRIQLFQALKSQNLRLAVLSNETLRMQTRKLSAFEESMPIFERLLTSEERGVEKPALSLFEEMIADSRLSREQILMIGDSYENDIEPCLNLGIPCLQTVEFLKPDRKHTELITDLNQVLEKLSQLRN